MVNTKELSKNFYAFLEKKGYKGKIVSAKYMPELKNRFQQYSILLDAGIHDEFKEYFEFQPNVDFDVNSLFIMAIPQPHFEAIFHWNNRKISLLIPPTYLYGRKVIDQMHDALLNYLTPAGYNVAYARLPQKLLSVSCGLAAYGRNNITYVEGMGSFYRLSTFYSDYPCVQDNPWELKNKEERRQQRKESIAVSAVIFQAMGMLARELYQESVPAENLAQWLVKLREIDWRRENQFWLERGVTQIGATEEPIISNTKTTVNACHKVLREFVGVATVSGVI